MLRPTFVDVADVDGMAKGRVQKKKKKLEFSNFVGDPPLPP